MLDRLACVVRPGPRVDLSLREELDQLLAQSLAIQLRTLIGGGASFVTADVRARVTPGYLRWVEESLRVLRRRGLLLWEDCAWRFAGPFDDLGGVSREWQERKSRWMQEPDLRARVGLAEEVLGSLREILSGDRWATDVLFPHSSLQKVEGIYKDNPVSDYFNLRLADALIAYLEERIQRDPAVTVRVLEIGAGTGGTTACVLVRLQPYRRNLSDYAYTDLSKAFLMHGESSFGAANPFLSYHLFDVSQPLCGQTIRPGAYDVVIATNVLHATRDIRVAVRNAKAALARHGVLLLNEVVRNDVFTHLTFGLLDGWWLFEDADLRIEGCPVLRPDAWRNVLSMEGFLSIEFPARESEELGQQIIVAESNGVVRQARAGIEPGGAVRAKARSQPTNQAPWENGRPAELRERAVQYLRALVAKTIKFPENKIRASEPLESYGIDSILVIQLTHALSEDFCDIRSALFFECQTIDALVDRLLGEQPERLRRVTGLEPESVAVDARAVPQAPEATGVDHGPGGAAPLAQEPETSREVPGAWPEIAVIGLAGRYPMAPDLGIFWERLRTGTNCITEVPPDRWDWRYYFAPEKGKTGTIYTRWGGFLEDADCFDPLFFQISPKEAERMDPQERVLLETAYWCIEDAGYAPSRFAKCGKVGVFVGVMNANYATGASFWSIANRVSYQLNLQGPSVAVDTACSSSLTALHLALESLYTGTSDCALAGGVNVGISLRHALKLSGMSVVSTDRACKAFGEGADGFVDAEGVGVVLLKPLARALADGDAIYGVIKGSMVNSGGKTNGYTVPNPVAQAELISAALRRSGVSPREISYLEAHGTGTALGDPIEIAGLSRAFAEQTSDKQFCAIGSVKSNIGHCESAAGIAGLTKILLQLRHHELAPTLHAQPANPQIDFCQTPFVLQHELDPWRRPRFGSCEIPRIAGLSSFGAGGANAHVIVREHIGGAPLRSPSMEPVAIVLSARTEERLRTHAKRLGDFLGRTNPIPPLEDLAYTLQVGRDAMEERVAFMVASLDELRVKLRAVAEGRDEAELLRGQLKRDRDTVEALFAEEELQSTVEQWVAQGKFRPLLRLWVKGLEIDWSLLYTEPRPPRVHLPGYPFLREHYWLERDELPGVSARRGRLHPLVHENVSSLAQQRFRSAFSGREFFFADHVVDGRKLLPGATFLEIARFAYERSVETASAVRLSDVVWLRPIVAGERGTDLEVSLSELPAGACGFEVTTSNGATVCCRGTIASLSPGARATLNLAEIEAACALRHLDGNELYEKFNRMGLAFGPSHRGVASLRVGPRQAMAKLVLPAAVADTTDDFDLHPSLVDSAVQASMGLAMAGEAQLTPVVLFAIGAVDVFARCAPEMWACVSLSETGKCDVALCDEDGRIAVRLSGIALKGLGAGKEATNPECLPAASSLSALLDRLPSRAAQIRQVENAADRHQASFDRLLGRLLLVQLQTAGLLPVGDVMMEADAVAKVPACFRRWFDQSLTTLAENGLLVRNGGTIAIPPSLATNAWDEWKGVDWQTDPCFRAQAGLAEIALRALPDVLSEHRRATDVLFADAPGGLLASIYRDNPVADLYNELLADVLLAYINEGTGRRNLRVLEIGAGTGGTTSILLRRLEACRDRIDEYCFTDVSKAFLLRAEKEFDGQYPFLRFRSLDIEHASAEPSLEVAVYDVVIAANVLHATRDVRRALRHARAWLRPFGLLLLNELNAHPLFAHVSFGLLEGWWLFEDQELRIPGGPGLNAASWRRVLQAEGFQAVAFPATQARQLGQEIIVAVASGDATTNVRVPPAESLVAHAEAFRTGPPEPPARAPEAIQATVLERVRVAIRACVCQVLKLHSAVLQDDENFSRYGVDSIIAVELVNLIRTGLGVNLPTTALFDHSTILALAAHLVDKYGESLRIGSPGVGDDRERNGVEPPLDRPNLGTNASASGPAHERNGSDTRLFAEASTVDHDGVAQGLNSGQAHDGAGSRFQMEESYRRVLIELSGSIDNLRIVETPLTVLAPGEVRIAVRSFSLNFSDLLCVKGLYPNMPPFPLTPGAEASGIVEACGSGVTILQPGDRVIVLPTRQSMGCHADFITCCEADVFPMPAGLSFEEACALPAVSITMLDAFRRARPTRAERILIQTAAGGVGLIAVQLAKHHGLEIFATAGSGEKLAYLRSLGVHHLINYQQSDFEQEIQHLTGAGGVDIVINTLPGEAIAKGIRCLACGGRYVELAMTALKSAKTIDLSLFADNQTFIAVDMRKLGMKQPDLFRSYVREMAELVGQGVLRPTISRVFPFADIQAAYRFLEQRHNIGKVVVSIPEMNRSVAEESKAGVHPKAAPKGGKADEMEQIAIIGLSGRFAGSPDVAALWQHLASGTDLVAETKRWDLLALFQETNERVDRYCRHGSFVDGIECFDPEFFSISGLEATYMDPQQRLFLEEAWHALEDAGYAGAQAAGCRCGVYVGCSGNSDYRGVLERNPPSLALLGNISSLIPARIAYHLNLHGPAIAVDTACSSSLVAVHLACQSLRTRETDMALAGGVYLQSTPDFYLLGNRSGMLSPTGRCHAFDDRADGFVPGEGVGVVVLKRLKDALAGGDSVCGIIRGSGVNQDGATNGITAPSANSQERLIREVYDRFGVDAAAIQMVEAHGTGTKLGDPIEFEALTRAFRKDTVERGYCAIGSIKTNLGHTTAAAGIAGMLKVLLALKHRQIPASLHFARGNREIEFNGSPFYVNTRLREWTPGRDGVRRAAVSSFGLSGTNAHVVIEEATAAVRPDPDPTAHLIVLSARTGDQLRRYAEGLRDFCRDEAGLVLANLSFTLFAGRRRWRHRLACVVRSVADAVEQLERWLTSGLVSNRSFVSDGGEFAPEQAESRQELERRTEQAARAMTDEERIVALAHAAHLFVRGYESNLESLFPNGRYRRISAPRYPFAREQYWAGGAVLERSVEPTALPLPAAASPTGEALLLSPVWDRVFPGNDCPPWPNSEARLALVTDSCETVAQFPGARPLAIVPDDSIAALRAKIETFGTLDHLCWVLAEGPTEATPGAFVEAQERGVLFFFRAVKALLELGYGRRDLGLTIVTHRAVAVDSSEVPDPAHASLHGLVGSLTKEYTHWQVRLIDTDQITPDFVAALFRVPPDQFGDAWVHRSGVWYRQGLAEVQPSPGQAAIHREGGVYVVIGGAGGIGVAWTEYMIRHHRARVIWLGRRQSDATIAERIAALARFGPAPEYLVADAADRTALDNARKSVIARHGAIHGVVHSALVLADQSVANMDPARFRLALDAKVSTSVRLAEVFGGDELDFLLFFSSLQSFTKNQGQSNYAAGCTFVDSFARWMAPRVRCAVKVMSWGYWGAVGAVASESYRNRMESEGIGSIEAVDGLEALKALLEGPIAHLGYIRLMARTALRHLKANDTLAMCGESRVRETLAPEVATPPPIPDTATADEMDALLVQLLRVQLTRLGWKEDVSFATLAAVPSWSRRWLRATEHYVRGSSSAPSTEIWRDWDLKCAEWRRRNPAWEAKIELVDACLRSLPEILRGEKPATEVVFPNGSMARVERVYRETEGASFFNEAVAEIVASVARASLAGAIRARLRILEIGAGTGSTSAAVFRHLEPWREAVAEYCYTDVSKAFLLHAENNFRIACPTLHCQLFNVEQPPRGQGVAVGAYDIVIAANALHATRDISVAVRNAKAVLKRDGLLVLNEICAPALFNHLTFGLLEGWWLAEDPELRIAGSPTVAPAVWQAVLQREGFLAPAFPVRAALALGQQIITAWSDGVIRQSGEGAVIAPNPPAELQSGALSSAGIEEHSRSLLRETVVEQLSVSLKIPFASIREDAPFADYGLDSISGVYFIQALNKTLAVELTPADLFSHTSVRRLTAHIASHYPHSVSSAARAPRITPAPMAAPSPSETPPSREIAATRRAGDPIAIIGMSGRFAESDSLEELWRHLEAGHDLVRPAVRWDLSRYGSERRKFCVHGSYLEEIDRFDASFFNIAGTEAAHMDPQQRLFLEETWKALEDAGYAGLAVEGKCCGVYVGCAPSDYPDLFTQEPPAQAMWGNSSSIIPARVAYFLNLQGPAVAVDTACSSSLVAVHLACQGLWMGETEMAVAGGVSIRCTPQLIELADRAEMLSAGGRCYTFDQRADGFVPGEGVGAIVLKRLKDALADGDYIHGVIRGSAINQDGATNGITAPSAESQERLQRQVYRTFGIDPADIQMVEAHGTGTKLGDPIEFAALTRSFREWTNKEHFCALGSIKSTLGHTLAAAGIAGLFRILLSLRHGKIPAALHFGACNPAIQISGSPFYINREARQWDAAGPNRPRLAAISSFGFSGTNAHLVVEEPPTRPARSRRSPFQLILASAQSGSQLRQVIENMVAHLGRSHDIELADIAYTLLLGRRHLPHRLACVAADVPELCSILRKWLSRGTATGVSVSDGTKRPEQPALRAFGSECIQRCAELGVETLDEHRTRLAGVAELLVQGYELDYAALFARGLGFRISLPTYPFAKERYWAAEGRMVSTRPAGILRHSPVPSDPGGWPSLGLASEIAPTDFLLSDHVVSGMSLLPGAACIEMARAAFRAQETAGSQTFRSLTLRDIAWPQPALCRGEPLSLRVEFRSRAAGELAFSIVDGAARDQPSVHCTGLLVQGEDADHVRFDVAAAQRDCGVREICAAELYAGYRQIGIEYGPSFQVVEKLWVGVNRLLSHLVLPATGAAAGYMVHPAMLDAALHSSLGWLLTSDAVAAQVPFALDEIVMMRPTEREMWADVRMRESEPGSAVRRLDVDLYDDTGSLCLRSVASRHGLWKSLTSRRAPTLEPRCGLRRRGADSTGSRSLPRSIGRFYSWPE